MSPTVNSHDATNSYNLTNRENINEHASDDINTSNIDFTTFLNNSVVADGAEAKN